MIDRWLVGVHRTARRHAGGWVKMLDGLPGIVVCPPSRKTLVAEVPLSVEVLATSEAADRARRFLGEGFRVSRL